MSRTTRKQAEWTLHRALDDQVSEGAYPLASDDIVVQSVEERIVGSLAAQVMAPLLPLACTSRAALRGPTPS